MTPLERSPFVCFLPLSPFVPPRLRPPLCALRLVARAPVRLTTGPSRFLVRSLPPGPSRSWPFRFRRLSRLARSRLCLASALPSRVHFAAPSATTAVSRVALPALSAPPFSSPPSPLFSPRSRAHHLVFAPPARPFRSFASRALCARRSPSVGLRFVPRASPAPVRSPPGSSRSAPALPRSLVPVRRPLVLVFAAPSLFVAPPWPPSRSSFAARVAVRSRPFLARRPAFVAAPSLLRPSRAPRSRPSVGPLVLAFRGPSQVAPYTPGLSTGGFGGEGLLGVVVPLSLWARAGYG